MRNSAIKALLEVASKNANVVLITADLGYGLFEEFSEKFPSQFINIGIAEQNMIGVASGLAMEGKIVYVYSIGNFPTLRCLEQIRNDAAYHELNVNIICMGAGFSYGILGYSHHATEDIGIMRALPGISIISPSTEYEAYFAIMNLGDQNGVSYLRLDKSKVEMNHLTENHLKIGTGSILKEGTDYSIISCGGIIQEALEAALSLENKDISCKVISMHTIKPIDQKIIDDCLNNHKGIITLEEANTSGGLGSAVLEAFARLGDFPERFKMLGIEDTYEKKAGSQKYLRDSHGLNKENIEHIILNWENEI